MFSKATEREDILSRYRQDNSNYNILPSYHMDKGIVKKKLNPGDEVYQFHHEPPAYNSSACLDPTISVQSFNSCSENTITVLDNLDSLASLQDMVKQDIFFTNDDIEATEKPVLINNETLEYKQGDTIRGYITIENLTSKAIPLNVYYVLFEGIYCKDRKCDKFLQMIDFKASLNYDSTETLIDRDDGTYLTMGTTLLPKIKYKRFFTFRVPSSLLECACGNHLGNHLKTPPSCGDDINDLMPASIRYNIRSALICNKNNEYYILADITRPVRIIPRADRPVKDSNNALNSMCKSLLDEVDLELSSSSGRYLKSRYKIGSYVDQLQFTHTESHEFSAILKNRRITTNVHNREYKFKYYPPHLCHIPQSLEIPVDLVYDSTTEPLPVIKRVSCELVVVSINSTDYSIPQEIDHNLLFLKQTNLTFDDLVIRPALMLLKEINKLRKQIPSFTPDPQSMSNLKCLSYLSTSYVTTSIDTNVTMDVSRLLKSQHTRTMQLHLNLNSMYIKDLDKAIKSNRFGSFCLLPSFQSCKLVRMYYMRVILHLHNEDMTIHVPITVE